MDVASIPDDVSMRSANLSSPVVPASSSADRRPVSPELCWYCTDEQGYALSVGRKAFQPGPASVRFDGKAMCGYCAIFHYGVQPAMSWARIQRGDAS